MFFVSAKHVNIDVIYSCGMPCGCITHDERFNFDWAGKMNDRRVMWLESNSTLGFILLF